MPGRKNRDDRQIKFLSYYLDPESETYSNARQSALKARYSAEYADVITNLGTKWLSDAIRKRETMLVKAERNLDEFLDMDTTNTAVTKQGDAIQYDDPKLKKIKADVSIFTAETIGKKHYSKRSLLEDEDGKNMLEPLSEAMRKLSEKK